MERIEVYFPTVLDAEIHAEALVRSGRIDYYEITPTMDEFGVQLYVRYVRGMYPRTIDITAIGDTHRKFTLG